MHHRQTSYSLEELIARHMGTIAAPEPGCLLVNEIGQIALDLGDDEHVEAQQYLARVLAEGAIDDRYPAFGYAYVLVLQDRAEPALFAQVEAFEDDPATKALADLVKVRAREIATFLSPCMLA